MAPSKPTRSLFFTARTPWGRYPQHRTGQNYLRASEDKPLDPASKSMQGLGGQMAPNQLSGSQGSSGQAGGNASDVWKVPHTDPRDYQVQQQPKQPDPADWAKAKMWAQTANPAQYPPSAQEAARYNDSVKYVPQQEKGLFGGHLRGSFDYGRDHPKTDRTDGSFEGGYHSNPRLQDELEEEELRNRPIQVPETGEQPKPKLPAYDEKKEKEMQQQQSWGTPQPLG